ncbi:hypothetical protein Tco_0317089 [Tanacetum coccineum]
MGGKQEDEEDEELYGDLNLILDTRDAVMTDAQTNQETEEAYVTLTTKPPVAQQQSSSVSSNLVSKFINPTPDTGIDSILNLNVQSNTLVNVPVPITIVTPSSDTIIPQTPIPIIQPQQQTHDSTTTITIPITTLPKIPIFASLFGFERRVSSLETELSELKQTNQFAEALSSIPSIIDNYLASKMKEAVDVAVQLKSDKLKEKSQAENQDFLNSLDSDMKIIIKEQIKAQTSKIMSKVEKYVTKTLGAEVLVRSTNQPQTSYTTTSSLSELELIRILLYKMKENKSIDRSDSQFQEDTMIKTRMKNPPLDQTEGQREGDQARNLSHPKNQLIKRAGQQVLQKRLSRSQPTELEDPSHQEFNTGDDDVTLPRETQDERQWHPSNSPTPDREWHHTKTVTDQPPQPWITQLA